MIRFNNENKKYELLLIIVPISWANSKCSVINFLQYVSSIIMEEKGEC